MSIGLISLLDDVAAIAKVAAASLDDIATQATKAGAMAGGVVVDDTAVLPRYMVGFSAKRELPIVGKMALGSLRNKLLILLPGALLLSYFAPWAITPLLMIGGVYLCYEGSERVYEIVAPHSAQEHEMRLGTVALDAKTFEDQKIASAIKTDFILSAEITAIALSSIPEGTIVTKAAVLAVVGVAITVLVYGLVALLVKADDLGVAMARNRSASVIGATIRMLGHNLVAGMPYLLAFLSAVGTAAMIWVGGSIVIHGLEFYGLHTIGALIHQVAETAAHALPAIAGVVEWIVTATGAGIFGLAIGAALIPVMELVVAPTWRTVKTMVPRRKRKA